MKFPEILKDFINKQNWIFAKTYAGTWPHEYIVEEQVDKKMLIKFANHIDNFGYEDYFYKTILIYFDYNGFTYWHMDNIINRCEEKNTYRNRKKDNRLPENVRR